MRVVSRKYLFIVIMFVVIAITAIGVIPTDKADVVQATTDDGTNITMYLRAWQPVGDVDTAFIVRFVYTGGHGSGGDLYANVPRLETGTTALQYRSAAIDTMIDVIVAREARMDRRDESSALWNALKNYTGRVGQVTLR